MKLKISSKKLKSLSEKHVLQGNNTPAVAGGGTWTCHSHIGPPGAPQQTCNPSGFGRFC
ncbi:MULTISPECIES: hypothetical protein [Pseudoalteromonas]|uniref:Uncharacterized protein n=1 Tax=Pseudoalteromonas luteoviolacea (strain 2ta16) TaxID=1353533 RepID=V4I409_PSEL2|nr:MULTISPECIES: hypothetical protein [Pseudoalteromonas]ESP94974.1 hypothetical protein PL2TA16_04530 [Pseudoalteromonas luteoviolacea 2ta16]KZN36306.1 hypothetical protein N483_22610 [Pseudoalteromonas luteoviolacea NCIMB 1944]MCG7550139.1 hypothetical protein [Pseudoalteromonas sp. Of7M-16]